MAIGDWMKSESWLANAGHVLGGACFVLACGYFTGNAGALGCLTAAFVVLVLVKEYVIDLHYESGETVASSTVDALGYAIGMAVAWGIWLLRHCGMP